MRKNFVRALAMAMAIGTMFSSAGLTSHAAETTDTTTATVTKQTLNLAMVAKVFDAKYYAATNSDVAAVTTDANKLLEHYMNYGIYEGRDASENFNASIYALANPDLLTAFGDNLEAMIEHYALFGVNENRVSCVSEFATMDPATRSAAVSASTEVVNANEGSGKYDYVLPATQSSSTGTLEENYASAMNMFAGHSADEMFNANLTYGDVALIDAYAKQNMWYDAKTKQAYAYGTIIYEDEVDEFGGRHGYGTSPSGIGVDVYNISDEGLNAKMAAQGYAKGEDGVWAPVNYSEGSSSSDSGSSSSDSGSSSSSSSDSGSSAGDFSCEGGSWDD